MPRVARYAKSNLIKSEKEEQFQRQLARAFYLMSQGLKPQKIRGSLLFSILKKPVNFREFLFWYQVKFYRQVASLTKDMFQLSQFFESIKNAAAHGGDALVVARRYPASRKGARKIILEFVIWDNGPDIQNIQQALVPGYTSRPAGPCDTYYGGGKGLDGVIAEEPTRYIANEIIIESYHQQVFRRHQTDIHHFEKSRKPISGTKVTLRFWSK